VDEAPPALCRCPALARLPWRVRGRWGGLGSPPDGHDRIRAADLCLEVRDFHISEEESDRWGYRTIVDGGEEDAVRIALERNVERLDWVLRPDYFRPNKARDPEFPLHLSEVMRFVQTYGRNKG
jgi:hypothetical protein